MTVQLCAESPRYLDRNCASMVTKTTNARLSCGASPPMGTSNLPTVTRKEI